MLRTFLTSFAIYYQWGALLMHILHGKTIEQPIEKLSESFLDLSLNWAAVGELKKRWFLLIERLLAFFDTGRVDCSFAIWNWRCFSLVYFSSCGSAIPCILESLVLWSRRSWIAEVNWTGGEMSTDKGRVNGEVSHVFFLKIEVCLFKVYLS